MKVTAVCVALLIVASAGVSAQETVADPDRWSYSFGQIGYFGGRTDEGLQGSDSGLAIGGGFGQRINRHAALEFDILFAGRVYNTPPEVQFADDQMNLANFIFTGDLVGILPFWLLEAYGGVGLGLVISELDVPSDFLPDVSATTEYSYDYTTQVLLGMDFVFTRKSRIGIEFRNSFITADFGNLSRGGVDIGGRMVMIKIKLPL